MHYGWDMAWFEKVWSTVRGWFAAEPPVHSEGGSAADVLREMAAERGTDADWMRDRNRLAVQVLSEADQQRLWKRAHRGATGPARLLSGIKRPSPEERRLLAELIDELERGR
jgi:hypothetical protein